MPSYNILFLIAAMLPAVVLCIYVYRKDRVEKEPVWLLMLMLALGALCVFPAIFFESFAEVFENDLAARIGEIQSDGTVLMNTFNYYGYQFIHYFLVVAFVEEGLKWLVIFLFIRKNKNFNSLFDGIIYSVFVSLGFAVLENIMYVFQYGLGNAVLRAVTAVPAHTFFGVFMGYFFSLYKIRNVKAFYEKSWGKTEKSLRTGGKAKYYLVLSFFVPVFLHGLYDFSTEFTIFSVAFIGVLGFLYIISFRKIRRISKEDKSIEYIAGQEMLKENPDVSAAISSQRK